MIALRLPAFAGLRLLTNRSFKVRLGMMDTPGPHWGHMFSGYWVWPYATESYRILHTMQERRQFLVTGCTGKFRHETPSQAAVNRLVAGSNPARGAIQNQRLKPTKLLTTTIVEFNLGNVLGNI